MSNFKTYKRLYAKPQDFNGQHFDSKLECDFYKECLNNEILLEHEPNTLPLLETFVIDDLYDLYAQLWGHHNHQIKTFSIQGSTWTPDFKFMDLYIECKGYQFWDDWLKKRKLIYNRYKYIKILVITSHSEFAKAIEFLKEYRKNETDK
jgi:hypothetical protein